MSGMSAPRGLFWCLVALSVAFSAQVSAQEASCQEINDCIFDVCGGLEDVDCVKDCIAQTDDEEAAGLFTAAIDCVAESDCPRDDFECLGGDCGEEFFEVNEYCGFDDEEEGPDCNGLAGCLEECGGLDNTECIDTCFEEEGEPVTVEVFGNLLECMREAGCDPDNEDCIVENCPDEIEELEAVCEFDGDDEGGRCDGVEACIDQCGAFEGECYDECVGNIEDQEAVEVFTAAITCIIDNGCDFEDEACILDNCLEEIEAFGEVCGFGDEEDEQDLGNEPVDDCEENPGPDCCFLANDGECDEPDFCDEGTDTTDCSMIPEPEPEPEGENQDDPEPEGDDEGGGGSASDEGCATAPGEVGGYGLWAMGFGLWLWRRRRQRNQGP